jgi:adenylosuccinate lyase
MTHFTHDTWISPLSWRYGSDEMRALWGESHKRRLWRKIWVALAQAQTQVGLVTAAQVADLRAHQDQIDLERAHQIEASIRHDLMAEVRCFAEQCPVGGGVIHLGATSMDVQDNADALRLREALDLILASLRQTLAAFADRVEALAHAPTMAFTHLQPAEPTTMGYRLAQYAQDLLHDLEIIQEARGSIRGKGFKGAAGTSASYAQLLQGTGVSTEAFEFNIMESLDLVPVMVATQVCPRKQEYRVLTALAALAQSLYRFAFDLRLLQSPVLGEWAEPFGEHQVGSSAMPFKRNPIDAENIDSMARWLATLPRVAWDNAAHSLLERTLDDSANRRSVLPEAFLIADELLRRTLHIVKGLRVDHGAAARLMRRYGPFAATERLLMEAAKRGGDRQVLHELIREHSLAAWGALQRDEENPLLDRLCGDQRLLALATAEELRGWLKADDYVGDAPRRAICLAVTIRDQLNDRK